MNKQLVTATELAAMIKAKAQASGKCDDLADIIVFSADRRDENWDYGLRGTSHAAPSEHCRNAISELIGKFKAEYDLK